MPKFTYKAKEGPGQIISGHIEADTVDNAIQKVIQLGLTPIDVFLQQVPQKGAAASKQRNSPFNFGQKVKLKDIVLFTRQVSDLVDASVPMLRALQIVLNQTRNSIFQAKVQQIYDFVKDGGSFSESLNQHRDIFSNLYVSMVRTGELGGQLSLVLNRLAIHMEGEQETRSKVKNSLAYPLFILIVGVITVFILLTYVVPQLSVMYDDFDQQLPFATRILTGLSAFCSRFWWLILLAGGFIFGAARQWLQTEAGRTKIDTFVLKAPIIGEFITIVEVGRFARTLGTLVESGVVITQALDSVSAVMENSILKRELEQASHLVANGASLKVAMDQCSFFPEMAVNMISVGEETGQLHKGLYKIADIYERESDAAMKTTVSLLGPIVLVLIVGVVGFVVVAMLMPIFQMNALI